MAARAVFFERYRAGASPLHRADSRVKLPATVAYILAITLTDVGTWGALGLLAAPLALLAALARLPAWLLLARTALALPFVLAAVPLAFTTPGHDLFALPLLRWSASDEGVRAVATILAKSWLAVFAAVLLTATTTPPELLRALRALRFPRLLVAVVFFAYRYLHVIGDEGRSMMRARDARSAELPGTRAGRTIAWRARVLGQMVGSLFTRSLERGERIHAAMQARGYDGELRFLAHPPLRAREIAAAALLVAYGAAVQVTVRL